MQEVTVWDKPEMLAWDKPEMLACKCGLEWVNVIVGLLNGKK